MVLTDAGPRRSADQLWYFLVGRDAGLVPYFFPGVLVCCGSGWAARRAPLWQWTTALASVGAILALLVLTPYTWNGGGGPPGNRYFLELRIRRLLFLVPAGTGPGPALVAALGRRRASRADGRCIRSRRRGPADLAQRRARAAALAADRAHDRSTTCRCGCTRCAGASCSSPSRAVYLLLPGCEHVLPRRERLLDRGRRRHGHRRSAPSNGDASAAHRR